MSSSSVNPTLGIRTKISLHTVSDVNEEVNMELVVVLQYPKPNQSAYSEPGWVDAAHSANMPPFIVKTKAAIEEQGFLAPRLEFENAKVADELDNILLMSIKNGRLFNIIRYRVTIREVLELERFPFDRQLFHIKLRTFGAILVPWDTSDDLSKGMIPLRIFNDKPWLDNPILVNYEENDWLLEYITTTFTKEHIEHNITIVLGMSRNPKFYMYNVALVEYIAVQMVVFSIAIPPSDYGTRASVNITLLLTMVAFKFVINSFLPLVNYLTWLDKYIILGVLLIGCTIIENFFISNLFVASANYASLVDKWYAVAFTTFWGLLHAILVLGYNLRLFQLPWNMIDMVQRTSDMNTIGLKSNQKLECRTPDSTFLIKVNRMLLRYDGKQTSSKVFQEPARSPDLVSRAYTTSSSDSVLMVP